MINPTETFDEKMRLVALYKTELLDTPYEREFTEIVELASKICKTPISTITLIDTDRQWFKAEVGMGITGSSRDVAFCSQTILERKPLIVEDAAKDERFYNNPLVTGSPYIRAYAGVPLTTGDGFNIGTLCVIDTVPRRLDDEQLFAIKVLANQVMRMIELRLKTRQLQALTDHLQRVSSVTAHDVRNPLHALQSIIALQTSNQLSNGEIKVLLPLVQQQLDSTLKMLDNLVEWGKIQTVTAPHDQQLLDLHQLAGNCIAELNLINGLKENEIINQIEEGLQIKADRNAIAFMLRNLLSNAVKFTSKGTISIAYGFANGQHTISVQDSGIGIAPEYMVNAEPGNFKRRDGTAKEKGSGLGLSLVKEQLTKMGGSLSFSTAAGAGTRVTISFC